MFIIKLDSVLWLVFQMVEVWSLKVVSEKSPRVLECSCFVIHGVSISLSDVLYVAICGACRFATLNFESHVRTEKSCNKNVLRNPRLHECSPNSLLLNYDKNPMLYNRAFSHVSLSLPICTDAFDVWRQLSFVHKKPANRDCRNWSLHVQDARRALAFRLGG